MLSFLSWVSTLSIRSNKKSHIFCSGKKRQAHSEIKFANYPLWTHYSWEKRGFLQLENKQIVSGNKCMFAKAVGKHSGFGKKHRLAHKQKKSQSLNEYTYTYSKFMLCKNIIKSTTLFSEKKSVYFSKIRFQAAVLTFRYRCLG